MQLGVHALMLQQVMVRSALHDPPVFNHHDFISLLNGRQTVSDNQRGTVFLQLIQRRLNGTLGLGIQRRGGFIKDQDRAVTQQRAGNSNTLALAAGQHHAILADDGIQTIIHLVNEIHGVGHARGLFNLLAAVLFGTGIGDIVGDGIVEQMHVL